jgi:predicted adenylyl cyclase CyaB
MVEVEIRGRLTQEDFDRLKALLSKEGVHKESHTREMIRLYDYPGFAEDPVAREVDIRLRDTDGRCEIMVKHKASENNVARSELSLKLADSNLDTAKAVLKSLGYAKGLWMHRKKDIYVYRDVEWSLVEAPKGYLYYEAEKEVESAAYAAEAEKELEAEAAKLNLPILSPDEYRVLIHELTENVNKVIEW